MNDNKSILAVDLDDVLYDFIGYFFIWHNQTFQTNLIAKDFHHRQLWEMWDGTKQEAAERIPRFFAEIDMLTMPPIAGSQAALGQLKETTDLIVISARDSATLEDTQAWLDKYFAGLFSDMHLGIANPLKGKKQLNKAELCKQLGVQTLIDDQLKNLEDCAKLNIQVILFGDYAWNRLEDLPGNSVRANTWTEVIGKLT